MQNVMLTREFQVQCEDLEAHLDLVMEELLALESVDLVNSDISASLETGAVEVSIVAISRLDDDSEAFLAAIEAADAAIRTAIHAAEGHTPGWVSAAQVTHKWVPVARQAQELQSA